MGTNTVLASVVERGPEGPRLVWEDARITRLGGGVDASRMLRDDAIARTLAAMTELTTHARAHGATFVAGVGTSALRDAANRDAFVARARAILDAFDVIDGAREAALTFRGAMFGLPSISGPVTVVDIGGGSTEIVRGEGERVHAAASVDVGSVRLTERHGIGAEAPSAETLVAMRGTIRDAMAHVSIAAPLVLVAGTATNVAAVALGRDLAGGAPVPHGETVPAESLHTAVARVIGAGREARRTMIGIEPGRHDVLVAGALILEHVLSRSGAPEALISDGGVRFGLALSLL